MCQPVQVDAYIRSIFPTYRRASTSNGRGVASPDAPKRSVLQGIKYADDDTKLESKLMDWRDQRAANILPRAMLRSLGPDIFMTDGVIDRLVLCAHKGKISSCDDILRETSWKDSLKYGEELLNILESIRPKRRPLAEINVQRLNVSSGTTTRRCGLCGIAGHTSE